MTKISRIKLDSRHLSYFLNNFWNVITLLENKEEVKEFLKDTLTHTEMKMVAKRIQIAKMLIEGHKYETIKKYVKVTDTTIAKVNNTLFMSGKGLKAAIVHLKKIEKDFEQKRMKGSSLKEKYPLSFLPEILADNLGSKIKKRKRRESIKNNISL
jgi:TrpR-related protein YerC/YecD